MTSIKFFAKGEPKGQPRPRAFVFRGQARIYNPAQAESWKTCIAEAAQAHIPKEPLLGPICVDLTFYFPRPKDHYGSGKNAAKLKDAAPTYHTSKPDRDNAEKAVLDALTILGFWRDDCQACDGFVKKLYAPPGIQPGCEIVITPIEQSVLDLPPQEPTGILELFAAQGNGRVL